jgi:hypothetical protein
MSASHAGPQAMQVRIAVRIRNTVHACVTVDERPFRAA